MEYIERAKWYKKRWLNMICVGIKKKSSKKKKCIRYYREQNESWVDWWISNQWIYIYIDDESGRRKTKWGEMMVVLI